MPVDAKLLEILVCPKPNCHGKLVETKNAEGEWLRCDACKLLYAVKDDIPNLLIDEARPAS